MAVIEIAKIQVRRGQENLTGMPQLDSGEFGWAEDTEHLYIGKRIADGAADDKNARILTENDLVNIFAAISSTSTSAVYYKYRQDVDYINTMTVAQTVQKKLDDASPSLTDFGVVQEYSGTDITLEFKHAVETIFMNGLTSNAYQRYEARRTLKIPAGSYTVSEPIDLPPYARIVGEGPGLTVITVTGPISLFRTVDASGNRYDDMDTMTDASLPKEIHLEGMTLQCTTASAYTASIVSLDNVNGARLVNCHIGTENWETTSSVFPFGSCVNIRGNLGRGVVGDTVQCKNVYINDCQITGLGTGILAEGTVIRPIIENNLLATLKQGVKFTKGGQSLGTGATFVVTATTGTYTVGIASSGTYYRNGNQIIIRGNNIGGQTPNNDCILTVTGSENGAITNVGVFGVSVGDNSTYTVSGEIYGNGYSPTNGSIVHNRFQNIEDEGIYVDTDTIRTNHLSSNNFFVNVGNGYDQYQDYITTSAGTTSIIRFNADGNKSVNDYFYRRDFANSTTSASFHYAPLIVGSTSLDDDSTYATTIVTGTNSLTKFVVNGGDQLISIRYQLRADGKLSESSSTSTHLSRKGTMLLNLSPSGLTHLSDTYDFVDELEIWSTATTNMVAVQGTTSTTTSSGYAGSSENIFWTTATTTMPTSTQITDGSWYLTGSDGSPYAGYAAQILARTGSSTLGGTGSAYIYRTDSDNPRFRFDNTGTTWTLLRAHSPGPTFSVDTSTINKNYVTLVATNSLPSSGTGLGLKTTATNTYIFEYQVNIVQ